MKIMQMIFLLQLFFFVSCTHIIQCEYMTGAEDYNEFIKAPDKDKAEAQQRFSSFSIEKQIDIFLYARRCPDNPNIGPFLYADGERKIPNIVRKIQTTEKVINKADLVGVLSNINAECRCVTSESEIIKTLEDVEKKLDADKNIPSNYGYKEMYSLNLKFLKEQIDGQNK